MIKYSYSLINSTSLLLSKLDLTSLSVQLLFTQRNKFILAVLTLVLLVRRDPGTGSLLILHSFSQKANDIVNLSDVVLLKNFNSCLHFSYKKAIFSAYSLISSNNAASNSLPRIYSPFFGQILPSSNKFIIYSMNGVRIRVNGAYEEMSQVDC